MKRRYLLAYCLVLFGVQSLSAVTVDTVLERVDKVFLVTSIQQAELHHAKQCMKEIQIHERGLSRLLKSYAITEDELEIIAINKSIESRLYSIQSITKNYLPFNEEWIRFKSAYQPDWVLLKGTGSEYLCYILVAPDGIKAIYEFYDGGLGSSRRSGKFYGNWETRGETKKGVERRK